MCGIAGVMHAEKNKSIDAQLLANMAAIQWHRGPDGFGVQIFDDHGVGFSHARLKIIDLDDQRARQPFVSADGNLLLAHNGEFYDYKRLRAEMTSNGARFRTKSDSELVLHLYPAVGMDEMLTHLRGEFAFSQPEATGSISSKGNSSDRTFSSSSSRTSPAIFWEPCSALRFKSSI